MQPTWQRWNSTQASTDEAQYETDPLLDNNNHLGLSAFLLASSLLPHTLSDTQSALASEGSNIFMKTTGAAIVALNRGYDFGRQYSAYACVSHHRFSTKFSYTYSTLPDTVCI
jgi:hypothetical protein